MAIARRGRGSAIAQLSGMTTDLARFVIGVRPGFDRSLVRPCAGIERASVVNRRRSCRRRRWAEDFRRIDYRLGVRNAGADNGDKPRGYRQHPQGHERQSDHGLTRLARSARRCDDRPFASAPNGRGSCRLSAGTTARRLTVRPVAFRTVSVRTLDLLDLLNGI